MSVPVLVETNNGGSGKRRRGGGGDDDGDIDKRHFFLIMGIFVALSALGTVQYVVYETPYCVEVFRQAEADGTTVTCSEYPLLPVYGVKLIYHFITGADLF